MKISIIFELFDRKSVVEGLNDNCQHRIAESFSSIGNDFEILQPGHIRNLYDCFIRQNSPNIDFSDLAIITKKVDDQRGKDRVELRSPH